jgi:phage regulator Rha-like protein
MLLHKPVRNGRTDIFKSLVINNLNTHFIIMKTLVITHTTTNNTEKQMMTSLEIAEVTGKQHKNVMQAIRKMEPAWEKVHGLKFQLMFREVEIGHGAVRQDPCYLLTKTESLYIATKFNDEARAKLVLRWEFLERERLAKQPQQLALPSPKEILAMADDIIGKGLRMLNEPAEDTLTATQVAKTFNMTTLDFNAVLRDMGIQYRRHGRWNLNDDLQGRGYTAERTHVSYSLKGEKKVRVYMTWTMAGLQFLNSKLGYPNF